MMLPEVLITLSLLMSACSPSVLRQLAGFSLSLTPATPLFPRVKWSLIFLVAAGNQHILHDLILVEQ